MSGGYVTNLLRKLGEYPLSDPPTKNYSTGALFQCCNCLEHKEDHVVLGDKVTCLFAPAEFQSMDPEEYKAWYDGQPEIRWLEAGSAGAEFVRDALKQSGFAQQILLATPVDEEKP